MDINLSSKTSQSLKEINLLSDERVKNILGKFLNLITGLFDSEVDIG